MRPFRGRNNSLKCRLKRTLTGLRGDYPERLPDFLVIGATRCGSTTLNRLLSAHPDVFVPPDQELHYFDNDALYCSDLSGYRELFGGYRSQRLIGEVTPSYCEKGARYDSEGKLCTGFDDDPIRRIARTMPGVRLVISLRDPLTRIRSIYIKNFYQGKLSHSLEEELEREMSGESVLRLLSRSQYHSDLQHILDHFSPNKLKVMIFEEWTRNQASAIPELFRFIGADPSVPLAGITSNEQQRYKKSGDTRKPQPDLSAGTRRKLIEATAESRAWLEDFLRCELPWMRK